MIVQRVGTTVRNLVEGEHSYSPVCHGHLICLIQLGIVGFTCARCRPPAQRIRSPVEGAPPASMHKLRAEPAKQGFC